jgi:hypothetical protein
MPSQIHSSLYPCDPNLSTDMKGYYASTRPDCYLIRKAMGLAQATQVENDYMTQAVECRFISIKS